MATTSRPREPNWRDARTYSCVATALGWAVCRLRVNSDVFVSVEEIQQHLGKIYQNRTPQWLYHNLLVTTNPNYNRFLGRARHYRINASATKFLADYLDLWQDSKGFMDTFPRDFSYSSWQQHNPQVGADPQSTGWIDVSRPRLQNTINEYLMASSLEEQLSSGEFKYQDQSQRLWNPLQHLRRDIKREILTNRRYCYHYDIQAAAPTLLLARARQICPDLPVPALQQLVNDPQTMRDHIQDQVPNLARSPQQAKRIINALVAGAQISTHPTSAILSMCYHNTAAIHALQASTEIQQLRRDLRQLWQALDPLLGPREIRTNRRGHQYRVRRRSRDRWALYFQLERQVLDQVRRLFRKHQSRVFLEHDGWSSQELVDPEEIQRHISRHLGFDVRIKWERS